MPKESIIHMEGERAMQFHSLLADIYETVMSLASSSRIFPKQSILHGEMHPAFTVQGFTKALEDKISTAMEMANGEDENPNKEGE